MRGVWHHQDRRRRGPRELTGIADHWREGSSHGPLEWTWPRAGLAPCTRTGWPSAEKTCAPGANRDARSPSRDAKNAIAWPAPRTQSARSASFTFSHSPATPQVRYAVASSKCETSSTKPHPPKADAWPHTSLSACQRVPSPKLLAWAGPYANGRTPTWPTSTQPEPVTHPTEAINGHYRTRQTHRQRLPQPHQLPAPNAPHRRRPRCLHPHSTLKSRQTLLDA